MCGIAGIVDLVGDRTDALELQRMTDALAHRGPDGQGILEYPGAALGHRRLSIIDLEGGAQPLTNEDGMVALTFNGEIYNFKTRRARLEESGHRFKTDGDSEVVVHVYEEWGEACVGRLRGMFAFAIWDDRRKALLLARDRLGIKPLLYPVEDGLVVFASELQAFQELADRPRQIE